MPYPKKRKPPQQITVSTNKVLTSKIKILQKELGLNDDEYRAMLMGQTGETSCTLLNDTQKLKVIHHMQMLRKKIKAQDYKKNSVAFVKGKHQHNKIRALFIDCIKFGYFQNRQLTTLNAFVKRQSDIDALEWVKNNNDIDKIKHALIGMLKRQPQKPLSVKQKQSLMTMEAVTYALQVEPECEILLYRKKELTKYA